MHQTKVKKKLDDGYFRQRMFQRQVKLLEMHQNKVKKKLDDGTFHNVCCNIRNAKSNY